MFDECEGQGLTEKCSSVGMTSMMMKDDDEDSMENNMMMNLCVRTTPPADHNLKDSKMMTFEEPTAHQKVPVEQDTGQVSVCVYDTNDFCLRHKRKGVWSTISIKSWKDRGGGRGFGYARTKKKVISCPKLKEPAAKSTFLSSWLKNHV